MSDSTMVIVIILVILITVGAGVGLYFFQRNDCETELVKGEECKDGFYTDTYQVTTEKGWFGKCDVKDGDIDRSRSCTGSTPTGTGGEPVPVNCDYSYTLTTDCVGGKYQQIYNLKTPASGGGTACPPYTNGQKVPSTMPCAADPKDCVGHHVSGNFGCSATKCGTQGKINFQYIITKQAEPGGKRCPYSNGFIHGIGTTCNAPAPPNCTP